MFGETRSTKQVDIKLTDETGKWWVRVIPHRRSFLPSFEELFWIIQMICECEDIKYPEGKGRGMVAEFLEDACMKVMWPDDYWEQLRKKYQLPEKD